MQPTSDILCLIVWFIRATPFEFILTQSGEPAEPLLIASARGPPAWEAEAEALQLADPIAGPEPDLQLDQTLSGYPMPVT